MVKSNYIVSFIIRIIHYETSSISHSVVSRNGIYTRNVTERVQECCTMRRSLRMDLSSQIEAGF